jgi:hypothetical protein
MGPDEEERFDRVSRYGDVDEQETTLDAVETVYEWNGRGRGVIVVDDR